MKNLKSIAQVVFNRMQLQTRANRLDTALKRDALWKSLTGGEHSQIGKMIAGDPAQFEARCPVPVIHPFGYTDKYGRGIYL